MKTRFFIVVVAMMMVAVATANKCTNMGGLCADARTNGCSKPFITGKCPGRSYQKCCPTGELMEMTRDELFNLRTCERHGGLCVDPKERVCNGGFSANKCGGAGQKCCLSGETIDRAEHNRIRQENARNADKTVCLTFDDGPLSATVRVMNVMEQLGVVGDFFFNAHPGSARVLPALKAAIAGGHGVHGHGYKHATVYNDKKGPFAKYAWPSMKNYKAIYGARDGSDVFKAHPESKQELLKNFQKNVDRYSKVYKENNLEIGDNLSLWRFCGDGRFMKGLIKTVEQEGKTPTGTTPKHVGWNFECAAQRINWAHLPATRWQDVRGVRCSLAGLPKDKSIILLHEQHWNNDLPAFTNFLKHLQGSGYKFALVNPKTGRCE